MRTLRAFEAIALVTAVASFGCGSDKNREASSPENTATYEEAKPEPMPTTEPSQSGEMTPASGMQDTSPSATESERKEGAAPQPAKTAALTDEQIAAVTDAANGAEIDAAKLAVGKTKNARVRKFAQMMIDDHKKAKQDQTKLMTKLGMTTSSSQKLEQFKTSAADTDRTLRAATADTFDKVYIDLQVADHQMVLDALDRDFIPNAQNPELKQALEDFRPKVAHHLDEALEIQKALMSAPAGKTGSSTPSGSKETGGRGGPKDTSGNNGTRGTNGTSGTAAPGATPNAPMK